MTERRGIGRRTLKDGSVRWYARVFSQGRQFKRGSFLTAKQAQDLYWKLKGAAVESRYFPDRYQQRMAQTVTVDTLCELVCADYRRNRFNLRDAQQLAGFWHRTAGPRKAVDLTGSWLLSVADQLLHEGLSPSTVNRRVDFLLRGYRLAREADPPLLTTAPKWQALEEPPPRAGFIEYPDFQAIRSVIAAHVRIPITILFWTGMRTSEAISLLRTQLAFHHPRQLVRLALSGNQTKNREPRTIVMGGDLYEVLSAHETSTQRDFPTCPWVCHHHGRPIRSFRTAWNTACVRLGLASGTWMKGKGYWKEYNGLLVHDLRRTGVRNLDRAGVGRDTARRITGHKTDSVFSRYNIVSEEDLAQAGQKVVAYLDQQHQD